MQRRTKNMQVTLVNKPKGKKGKKRDALPIPISGKLSVMTRAQDFVFPRNWRRVLRYVDAVTLTSTSGGQAYYQFRANSLFDPDLSGTGHQPRGFDQLCSSTGPYLTYRVHGCTARLVFPPSGANVWNIAAGFTDTSTVSAGASGQGIGLSYAEQPGWIGSMLPADSGQSHEMILKATMSQIHNVPPVAIATDDQYAAAYNANPVDTAYFTIVGNIITVATGNIFVGVLLEFDVTFEDPYMLTAS
jgi:hypothetical protein